MRRHLFTAAAVALALMAFAQPAAAQQYRSYHDEHVATQQQCERSRNNRTAGGAVIGGVLGALLGREVADRGVRGEGAGLGAVVGAVAGGAVGRSTARCDQVRGQYDQYGRPTHYPSQQPYYGAEGDYGQDDDLYGGPYEDGHYRGDDRDCRMGEQITRAPNGREYREEVLMCRDRNGEWRPQ
jgi:uncharacterized protein YcfJ